MNNYILNGSKSVTFTTNNIIHHERFEYWHDVVCKQIINVDCKKVENTENFSGNLRVSTFSNIRLSEIHCDPSIFYRTKQNLANNGCDYLLLTMRLTNASRKILDKHNCVVSVGDLSLYHCDREQVLGIYGKVEALLMQIPITRISALRAGAENLNGILLRHDLPVVRLLSNQMKNLALYIDGIDPPCLDLVIDNFLRLLIICIDGANTKNVLTSEGIKDALLNEIMDFIKLNLDFPDLSPRYIAEKNRISLRYLYTLFKSRDISPCKFIQEERLKLIEALLKNNRKIRISDLAYQYGFNHVSHFSRLFKQKFGMSPKDYREVGSG